jgi:RNA polymerase sigma-70 factor (ECF subfamily)
MGADLQSVFEGVRRRWPSLALSFADFEKFVTPRLGRKPEAWEDLALVDACCRRVPGALELLEGMLRPQVRAVAGKEGLEDELTQRLLERLVVGPNPRLASFSGRGNLTSWLRAAAVREAINFKRSGGIEAPDSDAMLQRLEEPGCPPELQLLRARHGADFKLAFRQALGALTAEESELVRLHLVEHVSLVELARRGSVHRTTLARRLDVARYKIANATRDNLSRSLQLSSGEYESLLGFVLQHPDVSLNGLKGG